MLTSVSLRILTLFFLLGVGAFARYKKIINDEIVDGLISIVINITLPFLYFYSLSSQASPQSLKELWFLPLWALVIVGIGFVIALLVAPLLKLDEAKKKTFLFISTFTNYGFLAIPLVYMLFGEEGLFQIVIFNIGFNILFWTFGIWLISADKKNPFANLVNPGTVSLFLGLFAGLSSIKVPTFIMDASKLLGGAAIPLAMLTVGAMLSASLGKTKVNLNAIIALIVNRLILVPTLIFLIILNANTSFITKAIIILQAAMPSPSMAPLVTRRFGGDPEFAAAGVFFTTLISLITVSIFMRLIGV